MLLTTLSWWLMLVTNKSNRSTIWYCQYLKLVTKSNCPQTVQRVSPNSHWLFDFCYHNLVLNDLSDNLNWKFCVYWLVKLTWVTSNHSIQNLDRVEIFQKNDKYANEYAKLTKNKTQKIFKYFNSKIGRYADLSVKVDLWCRSDALDR